MFKIFAIRERFIHMDNVSGYDALYNHFPADVETESIFCNFRKMYPRGIGRLMQMASGLSKGSEFYNSQSFEAELRMLINVRKQAYDTLHYSYGEPYFGFGGSFKRTIKAPIIVTNHQPVSWWVKNSALVKKYIAAGKVITLSNHDRDHFNNQLTDKAVCIPHGVDISFFKPSSKSIALGHPFRVIFAGRYLRDMPALASVINKLSSTNIKFDIVYVDRSEVSETYLKEIMLLPNVTWHSNINADQLLTLYQQADCCLLPLLDCTANNAILEAMACALPIISTNLPAIHTYLDPSMSILSSNNNVDELCDAILFLCNNEQLRRAMGIRAREKATTCFDWYNIAAQTLGLFKSVAT